MFSAITYTTSASHQFSQPFLSWMLRQLPEHGVNSDRLVGHWSQRELEELHMFSAQLLGKHRNLANNLSAQDGTLQQLETFMQHTKQKPPTEARTAALLQRLQQHLTMIKVRW